MTVNNETPNRHYPQPHPDNVMKTVDVPRLITALEMLDTDMAAVFAAVAGKASSEHQHAMTEIIGLVAALAGKSPTGHNHGIGTLTGVDLSSAANGQFMKFNGSLWIPAFIGAADLAAKIIGDAHLRDSNGVSVLGRSVATPGRPSDISALTNHTFLRRVGDVLGFGKATIEMLSDVLATKGDAEAGTAADKMMTALTTAQAIAALASSQAVKVTEFQTGATYTKDPKARYVRAQVQGAAGGSGGARNSSATARGAAGGPGAYGEAWFLAANVGTTETITVGAGGSAGSNSPGDGSSGGSSSFGSKIVAPGGPGGGGGNNTLGIVGTTGNPTYTGTSFGRVYNAGNFGGGGAGSTADVSNNSYFGNGGAPATGGLGPGNAGVGFGAPPSGARAGTTSQYAGAVGQPGVVVVSEYF